MKRIDIILAAFVIPLTPCTQVAWISSVQYRQSTYMAVFKKDLRPHDEFQLKLAANY